MATAFIFYGIGGSVTENWFPWMKAELAKKGIDAVIPAFPNANTPMLDQWLRFFEETYKTDSDSIFIGHSLGCAFALRLLEKTKSPVGATFLVSPVWKSPPNTFAPLLTTFTEAPYNWATIKKNAGKVQIIHSDNDPYLPLPYAKELTSHLSCNMTVIPGGGHFNEEAGYKSFPYLRDSLLDSKSGGETCLG